MIIELIFWKKQMRAFKLYMNILVSCFLATQVYAYGRREKKDYDKDEM